VVKIANKSGKLSFEDKTLQQSGTAVKIAKKVENCHLMIKDCNKAAQW
jgi:hypothetical protein